MLFCTCMGNSRAWKDMYVTLRGGKGLFMTKRRRIQLFIPCDVIRVKRDDKDGGKVFKTKEQIKSFGFRKMNDVNKSSVSRESRTMMNELTVVFSSQRACKGENTLMEDRVSMLH